VRGYSVDAKTGAIIPVNTEAQYLYSLGLSNHDKFFVNKKTEAQLIVESLDLDFQNDEYVFEFSSDEKFLMMKEKKELGIDGATGPIIGLNTGCSPTIPYKKFSVRGWLDLIDHLTQTFPHGRLLLLGGPEDTIRNKEILAMRPGVTFTPTERGLRAGFRYVNMCDVVVTGDSLGMHMAIALKKWVVAWFGPTCAHEIEFYKRGVAIKTAAPCSPCWKRFCDKAQMCYDQVSWKEVSQGIAQGLKEKVFAPHAKNIPEMTAKI
jgi:heptosyltransferase-2